MKDLFDYLERLTVYQGPDRGSLVRLRPWQRRFLRRALSPDVSESVLTLARANGKTSLAAMVACAFLAGPLRESGSHLLILSPTLRQSMLLQAHILRFLDMHATHDKRRWGVNRSQGFSWIEHKRSGTKLQLLPCKAESVHGFAPAWTCFDECAQIRPQVFAEVMQITRTSSGKTGTSRIWYLGTRSPDPMHPFAALEKEADYVQLHYCTDGQYRRYGPTLRAAAPANPSMKYAPALRAAIQREARLARQDTEAERGFRQLRLNQPVALGAEAFVLDSDTWIRAELDSVEICPGGVFGLDLGGTHAMSALACVCRSTGHLDALAAMPGATDLEAHGRKTRAPLLAMHGDGDLLRLGNHTVPVDELLGAAVRRWGRPSVVVSDRFKQAETKDALDRSGLDCPVVFRGQGAKDGGEDLRLFRRAILEGVVRPRKSLMLRHAIAGARTVSDRSGNVKLAKGTEGGRKSTHLDDAIAAAILGAAQHYRTREANKELLWTRL